MTVFAAVATIAVMLLAGTIWGTTPARADGEIMHNPGGGAVNAPCAGCHRIHSAQSENLLKATGGTDELCLLCHGTGGSGSDLDVQSGQARSGGALRAGGFATAMINSADPSTNLGGTATIGALGAPAPVTSNHGVEGVTNKGGAGLTPWGGTGALTKFECTNCHDPHGGQGTTGGPTYRILRQIPTGSGAATGQIVTDEFSPAKHYTTTNYFSPNAGLTNASGTTSFADEPSVYANMAGAGESNWCALCHTKYFQTTFGGSNGAGYDYQHKAVDVSTRNGASKLASYRCVTCHASHGTNATMGQNSSWADYEKAWTTTDIDTGPGSLSGNDASRLLKMNDRGICRKCHANSYK